VRIEIPSIHSASTEEEGAERVMRGEEWERRVNERGETGPVGGAGGGADRRMEGSREEEAVRLRVRGVVRAAGRELVAMMSVMRDRSTVQMRISTFRTSTGGQTYIAQVDPLIQLE
jgi:hypothetical protein